MTDAELIQLQSDTIEQMTAKMEEVHSTLGRAMKQIVDLRGANERKNREVLRLEGALHRIKDQLDIAFVKSAPGERVREPILMAHGIIRQALRQTHFSETPAQVVPLFRNTEPNNAA